jgi:hypothetical protein
MPRSRSSRQTRSSKSPPDSAGVNENHLNSASKSSTKKKSRSKQAPDVAHTPQSLRLESQEKEREFKRFMAAKEREVADAKRQMEEQLAQFVKRRKTGSSVAVMTSSECPKEEKATILTAVAKHVWKHLVFMPAPGDLQQRIMQWVYAKLDPPPPKKVITKEEWVVSRANVVYSCFNHIRSYTCSGLKKGMRTYWKQCNRQWPSFAKFEACALRTIQVKAPEDATDAEKAECAANLDVFAYYWDSILHYAAPQATKLWEPTTRRVCKITNQRDYKDSPITAQMEAFVVICLDNNWTYWQNWCELELKFPDHRLLRAPKERIPAPDHPSYAQGYFEDDDGKTVYFFGSKFATKYSQSNAGSNITGGWSQAGKDKFQQLVVEIRKNRQTQENYELEHMVFERVLEKSAKAGANSGGTATLSGEEDNPKKPVEEPIKVLDLNIAMELGYEIGDDEPDEEEEDDRKMPARSSEHSDDDDESAHSYDEDVDLEGQISARESV